MKKQKKHKSPSYADLFLVRKQIQKQKGRR